MTQYLNKTFSVAPGLSAAYRDNYDAIFGPKDTQATQEALPREAYAPTPRQTLQLPIGGASVGWESYDEGIILSRPGFALQLSYPGQPNSLVVVRLEVLRNSNPIELLIGALDPDDPALGGELRQLHQCLAGMIIRWGKELEWEKPCYLGGGREWEEQIWDGLTLLAEAVGQELRAVLPEQADEPLQAGDRQ